MERARTLDDYIIAVDWFMTRQCGLGTGDIPDYDYATAFDCGVSPARCAKQAITAAEEF
jgi:hypothetical protein